jgi:hypothetical protein
MKKIMIITGIINLILAVVSFLLFIIWGGFDIYLGKGSPVWLCWIPALFLAGSAFNFFSAIRFHKAKKADS